MSHPKHLADDGCQDAPVNGSSGKQADLLTIMNGGTPYRSPPNWNVPGRDYTVGRDMTLTYMPVASWTPPGDMKCTLRRDIPHMVQCNAATSTCNPCVISGIDFTDYFLDIAASPSRPVKWIVKDNLFANGPTVAVKDRALFKIEATKNVSIDFVRNECDGKVDTYGWVACMNSQANGTSPSNPVTINILYNHVHDVPARPFNIDGTNAVVNLNWNYGVRWNQDQWVYQHVTIDSVAETMTVRGPSLTGGPRIHKGMNDCYFYAKDDGPAGMTRITLAGRGLVGGIPANGVQEQISGTPGGAGVYKFVGASSDIEDKTVECGIGFHGEFNASGIADRGQQNFMGYKGNLIALGPDCPGNGTSLIAYIVRSGAHTRITDGDTSFNTLINRVGGKGDPLWKGCAAHHIANNGTMSYGNMRIHDNALDPTNQKGFGASSTTACFANGGGQNFSGTQNGNMLTVNRTTSRGPLPIGAEIFGRGNRFYGTVAAETSVNPDGTGTYQMSDSRSEAFDNAQIYYAPTLSNSGGAIPYAPFYSNNFNMLLPPGSNQIEITDARMNTNSACRG